MVINEQQEAVIEEVKKLKKEMRATKRKVKELDEESEGAKVLGLHEQIIALDKKVDSVSQSLLILSKAFAVSEIDHLNIHMGSSISKAPINFDHRKLKTYINLKATEAREKAYDSVEPLSTLNNFQNECEKCSEEYGLNAFVEKP